MTLIRLKLIDMGLIKESEDVEQLCSPATLFPDEDAEFQTESEKRLQKYEEMYDVHIKSRKHFPDSRTKKMQRDVINEFYKLTLSCKSCSSCGSFSPSIRKDGYSKLFERPLAKRLRKSMQGLRINLKVWIGNLKFRLVDICLQPALETLMRTQGGNGSSDDDSDDDSMGDGVEEESDGNVSDSHAANDGKDKYLAPYEVEARLRLLWDCHADFLDFVWCRSMSHSTHLSHTWNLFFIRTILVPPSRFRPSADLGDVQAEHPQNLHLSKILTLNESLLKMASKTTVIDGKSGEMDFPGLDKGNNTDVSKIISTWIDLQNAVNCYLDSTKDPGARKSDESAIGIRQILEKKEGLFRRHMMGKRVNYCCRSVISPDPFLGMNEIGIPVRFAKELHYPTPVTSWNIKLLRQMVENGPDIYPGLWQLLNRCQVN